MTGIVIIGGGQAAAQNAACLRQEGYTGEITVFSDEQYVPYQRPPLSKDYLADFFPRCFNLQNKIFFVKKPSITCPNLWLHYVYV